MNKKAQLMFSVVGLALGIVILATIATIGIVVLGNFASSQAACPAFVQDSSRTTTYEPITGTCLSGAYCTTVGGGAATLNTSLTLGVQTCYNASANYTSGEGVANIFNDTLSASLGAQSAYYAEGTLSNNSGGLLTWLPVIIPAIIGIGILGYFLTLRKGQTY